MRLTYSPLQPQRIDTNQKSKEGLEPKLAGPIWCRTPAAGKCVCEEVSSTVTVGAKSSRYREQGPPRRGVRYACMNIEESYTVMTARTVHVI